jgi:hypothetical protein
VVIRCWNWAVAPAIGLWLRAVLRRRFLLNDGCACKVRDPRLDFIPGEVEVPVTFRAIEGPFDYIVIADTIVMDRLDVLWPAPSALSTRLQLSDHSSVVTGQGLAERTVPKGLRRNASPALELGQAPKRAESVLG